MAHFFFFIFHALLFEINFVCDRSFPSILNISNFSKYVNGICTQLHYLEATSIETAIVLYAIMSIFGSNQNIIGQVVSQYKYASTTVKIMSYYVLMFLLSKCDFHTAKY